MNEVDLFFNIFNLIVGIITVISVIILCLEFRNSNKIRKKENYLKLFNSIKNHLENWSIKDEKFKSNKYYNSILRYLILISFNLKLKKLDCLNDFLSEMLEILYTPLNEIDEKKFKVLEEKFKEILKIHN